MHRFRKKSDAKRAQAAEFQEAPTPLPPQLAPPQIPLPSLPPVSDFRTSLILPDLTRRFSVLRNADGIPIGFHDLKSKFAEQRAKGSENQVTEEEEDMILEALGRIHARSTRPRANVGGNNEGVNEDPNDSSTLSMAEDPDGGSRISASPSLVGRQSVRSTATTSSSVLQGSVSATSVSSGKTSQYSRRMSNNLFGSGKFRDHSYMRTQRTRTESTRSSVTQSDSNPSTSTVTSRAPNNNSVYSDSLRPVTPENGSVYTSSAPGSPNNNALIGSGAESIASTQGIARLSKTLSPEHLKRASLALDEVIRELEEEGDDEIVMERSPINRLPVVSAEAPQDGHESSPSPMLPSPADYEAGASSSDDQIVTDADESQRVSPFPSNRATSPAHGRLPGYIPGMPRPMTPHDNSMDLDDQTPSATPRATSPRLPGTQGNVSHAPSQIITSNMYRSNSSASTSRQTSRPTSPTSPVTTPISSVAPLMLNRSTNGRFTPEDRSRNGGAASPTSDPLDSPILGRRRPISPLSAPAFQPLASMSSGSRPSAPSNITWNVAASPTSSRGPHVRNGSSSGHSRSDSSTSIGMTSEGADAEERPNASADGRRVRSPALPDSPWVDSGRANGGYSTDSEYRPSTAMSAMDLGSPIQIANRPLRSPTPTNNGNGVARSPTSPSFPEFGSISSNTTLNGGPSRRSSRQNGGGHHSSFSLGSTHALLLSPLANSSHSSLESAGSSYHSWDEDHKKDRLFTLFSQLETEHTEWHDITVSVHDKTASSSASASIPHDAPVVEADRIVKHELGLSRNDFIAIQERLVNVALTKAATPEGRHRAASIRRRRPSTSQSNYSNNGGDSRVASPAPAPQLQSSVSAVSASRSPNSEHIAKVNALLDSVVDSIQAPQSDNVRVNSVDSPASASVEPSPVAPAPVVSTPTQRHRALADALFGVEDRQQTTNASEVQITVSPDPAPSPAPASERADSSRTITMSRSNSSARDLTTSGSSGMQTSSMPSSMHGHTHMDPTLLFEVQRRAEAATAALRKSPSNPKLAEGNGSTRKRVSPNQISPPKLVSASTSVDTIPLPPSTSVSANQHSSSIKFGSRFKKLRGTLRSKPQPNGEEISPFPLDLKTPTSAQTLSFSPATLSVPGQPTIFSANESTQFRVSPPVLPSPPASAGPTSTSTSKGGFFSRFRKQRPHEVSAPLDRHFRAPRSSTSSSPNSAPATNSPEIRSAPVLRSQSPITQPAVRSQSPVAQPASSRPMSPHMFMPNAVIPEDSVAQVENKSQDAALQQLFDAANNLGLDQDALHQLIARSPSTSSRSTWTQLSRATSPAEKRRSQQRTNLQLPALLDQRPSIDAASPRPSTEVRQLNIRKNTEPSIPRLRPDAGTSDAASNAIVRRTIIYPSDSRTSNVDWNALIRKQSTSRRRRSAGAGSLQSNRSIHDRAPTPPPPKSGGKRFSSTSDTSPPVPQLPQSFTIPDISFPPEQMEKSNSAYDSLYDMYAGDSRGNSSAHPDTQGPGGQQPEAGQALEVVELANGETIWSIVNGLRDDDAESFYDDRASFASEYSVKETEAVKVSFKEHGRKSSKGSTTSFLSRRKQVPAVNRPETKVFFSSSAQIGRLIENLSRGMDSGSFNITPDGSIQRPAGHSATSSIGSDADMRFSVEERLEQMLGSMTSHPQ